MSRVLLAVGLVLAALVALGAAVGWLAEGPAPTRDGTLAVPGLGADVAVAWPDSGGVAVEAKTWADAMAGLGYVHAADHAFAMALWRQTARGETAAWFGDSARTADLHARRLGFDALARQTYDGLDAPTRARLDAYARGVNAAFAEPGVAQADAFVWLGITPAPWQPWDALAVERLVAYLGTPALARDSAWTQAARSTPAVARFVRNDAAFRSALDIDGMGFARAFAAQTGGGTAFVAHQPAGTSALALFVPVAFRVGTRSVAAATVPGTLSFPAGTDGASAWSVFLTSEVRIEPFAGTAPLLVYSRIVERDGDEALVAVARDSSGLVLGRATRPGPVAADSAATDSVALPPQAPARTRPVRTAPAAPIAQAAPADSVRADTTKAPAAWQVRWSGFRLGTDVPAFAALAEGRAPGPFEILSGDGLLALNGSVRPLGRPLVAVSSGAYSFVAADDAARWAPARLDSLLARFQRRGDDLTARLFADDAQSPWALARLPPLLRALGPRDSVARDLVNANAFLRSWDGAYTADAIAPTIFEAWLDAHRAFTGHLPDPADSADVALLPYTLRIARGELRDAYGPDESAWRWGQIRASVRTPILRGLSGAPGRRYADALAGPGGHPTALRPGPALVYDRRLDRPSDTSAARREAPASVPSPGPAVWSAWTTLGTGRLFVRGPGRADVSSGPIEAAFGDPGVTVGIDPGAALPARRLVLSPAR